ncbi:MAG: cysteine desulfurase [Deltaproteobacteria bacterium]|nr:cysteine desulfurase [Deltaproteobacteria bacterium]NCP02952.1 cysteine desulfurase [Deltaproteobacteria bacterium]
MTPIYLDHNATTAVHPTVVDAMLPWLTQHYGNPSSVHWAGRAANAALEKAREQVASLLNASVNDIIFTSGGTEGDNFAIKGTALQRAEQGRHLITTAVEHPAVLETCRALERQGWQVSYLPVDSQGNLDLAQLESNIQPQTQLISVMWANNEIGNIYPLAEISVIAKARGVCLHSDAVQVAGRLPIDVQATGLDLAVISGHKFGAPKGVGALFVKSGNRLEPLMHGGSQERHRRGGTSNLASIVGLGKACELAGVEMQQNAVHVAQLRERLQQGIRRGIRGVFFHGAQQSDHRLPNTLNASFAGISGESLLMSLDLKGIAVSSGSACSSGSLEASHVMTALGVAPQLAQSSIRFSLGPTNTAAEIDYVIDELAAAVSRLRQISPFENF